MAVQGCLCTLPPCFLLGMQERLRAQGCPVKAGNWTSRVSKAGRAWAKGNAQGKIQAWSPGGQGTPIEHLCVLICLRPW